jgi:hypothetical protein
MHRVLGALLAISLFLFCLGLPILHLHPGGAPKLSAVIHWHMPHAADVHHEGAPADPIIGDADSHDAKALPFEISSLCAASTVQPPIPDFLAILPPAQRITLRAPFVAPKEPEPRALAPPGVLIHLSLRSPPA